MKMKLGRYFFCVESVSIAPLVVIAISPSRTRKMRIRPCFAVFSSIVRPKRGW